jgi:hypothetical protein
MKFIEVKENSKYPILINVARIRYVQKSSLRQGSTVIAFDNEDFLILDEGYEDICKKIENVLGN